MKRRQFLELTAGAAALSAASRIAWSQTFPRRPVTIVVPFAVLIERGMISPGIKLTDAKRRHRALVRADGAVSLGEAVGSIHRIGALAQGLEACNGWTFWHIETPKGLTVIDTLRAQVRSAMAEAAE